jgi:AAA domain
MQKGGVGLSERGARVLLIDSDPQANLTQGLGIDPAEVEYSIYEVLLNPEQGAAFATLTVAGVDLVPLALALAGAELELAGKVGRELLLRKALKSLRDHYDYILIDPPPSLGLFALNALAAADAVIVPLQVHAYAFKARPSSKRRSTWSRNSPHHSPSAASSAHSPTAAPTLATSSSSRSASSTATSCSQPPSQPTPSLPRRRPLARQSPPTRPTALARAPMPRWPRKWRPAMPAKSKQDRSTLLGGEPTKPAIRRGQGLRLSTEPPAAVSQSSENAVSQKRNTAETQSSPKRLCSLHNAESERSEQPDRRMVVS